MRRKGMTLIHHPMVIKIRSGKRERQKLMTRTSTVVKRSIKKRRNKKRVMKALLLHLVVVKRNHR
jgi:hypothetical protein